MSTPSQFTHPEGAERFIAGSNAKYPGEAYWAIKKKDGEQGFDYFRWEKWQLNRQFQNQQGAKTEAAKLPTISTGPSPPKNSSPQKINRPNGVGVKVTLEEETNNRINRLCDTVILLHDEILVLKRRCDKLEEEMREAKKAKVEVKDVEVGEVKENEGEKDDEECTIISPPKTEEETSEDLEMIPVERKAERRKTKNFKKKSRN